MNSYLRVSLLGVTAGLLALLTLVAVVYLALSLSIVTFTLVEELAKARASGTPLTGQLWRLLGQSLVASGGNALRGLWALGGAFIVFGGLGLLAAWSHQVGQAMYPARAWGISFLVVVALVTIALITWIYLQGEQLALWMAEAPETYRWRDLLLDSHTAALTVSPIFAFAFTYPAWATWRWWYMRLDRRRFVRDNTALLQADVAHGATADHRAYATRMAALKRGTPLVATSSAEAAVLPKERNAPPLASIVYNNGLLALLALLAVGCFVGYRITAHYHAQVALRLQHGVAFVDAATQPLIEAPLQIAPDVRRLRIVNINGLGQVSLALSPAVNPTQVVGAVPEWAFQWRADDYLYQDIAVQQLAPGDYLLRFEQRAGWGYFEYMLSQGGGSASQTLAVVMGFLLATALLLTSAVVVLAVARLATRATA